MRGPGIGARGVGGSAQAEPAVYHQQNLSAYLVPRSGQRPGLRPARPRFDRSGGGPRPRVQSLGTWLRVAPAIAAPPTAEAARAAAGGTGRPYAFLRRAAGR